MLLPAALHALTAADSPPFMPPPLPQPATAAMQSCSISRRAAVLGASSAAWLGVVPPSSSSVESSGDGTRHVLVAGASGRTGRLIVEQLSRGEGPLRFDPIAGLRGSDIGNGGGRSRAPAFPPGTTVFSGLELAGPNAISTSDLTAEMLRLGVSDVICAVGFSPTFIPEQDRQLAEAVDYYGTLRLVSAAEACKLPGRFVLLSSLGVGSLSSSPSARLLDGSLGNVLVQKAAAERALKATGQSGQPGQPGAGGRSGGLDWTIVRPGLLLKEATQGGVLLGPEDRWTGGE